MTLLTSDTVLSVALSAEYTTRCCGGSCKRSRAAKDAIAALCREWFLSGYEE